MRIFYFDDLKLNIIKNINNYINFSVKKLNL